MKNHTRITRLLTALLTLCALFVCVAQAAMAQDAVEYMVGSWDETNRCVVYTPATTTEYTLLEGSATVLESGTYVVKRYATYSDGLSLAADATVNLILGDSWELTVESGLHVPEGATLNIYGQQEGTGSLTATGKANAAGIGGYYDYLSNQDGNCGTINIHGGTITANGKLRSAGIGGGKEGAGGTITIYGGTVTAKGGERAAGIGGGPEGAGGTITIYGGTVTATGKRGGAGIGGGNEGAGGTTTIHGGEVTATGGGGTSSDGGGSGIGGGNEGAGGTITIYGGEVTATGGGGTSNDGGGSGIGGGNKGASGTITIHGGAVEATGTKGGAGVGGGYNGAGGTITIYGGTVTATATGGYGDKGGAGIGSGGNKGAGGTITIDNGTITATGGYGGAGIGGGNRGAGGVISISGGTVTANGGNAISNSRVLGGAGIGGGYYGAGGTITISGGTVTANGGNAINNSRVLGGAGIGGGGNGEGGSVNITGGTIIATGGTDAASIGGGIYKNDSGIVDITGGNTKADTIPATMLTKVTLTLEDVTGNTPVYQLMETAGELINGYGLNDVTTLEDKLYFWMEGDAHTDIAQIVAGEYAYSLNDDGFSSDATTGEITGTYEKGSSKYPIYNMLVSWGLTEYQVNMDTKNAVGSGNIVFINRGNTEFTMNVTAGGDLTGIELDGFDQGKVSVDPGQWVRVPVKITQANGKNGAINIGFDGESGTDPVLPNEGTCELTSAAQYVSIPLIGKPVYDAVIQIDWDDSDDEYKKRPTTIQAKELSTGQEVTIINKNDVWKGTAKDVPELAKVDWELTLPEGYAESKDRQVDEAGKTTTVTLALEYQVTIDDDIQDGKVTLVGNKSCFRPGETVMLSVVPSQPYWMVKQISYNGTPIVRGENGTYSFTMPAENVTVTAEFAECTHKTYNYGKSDYGSIHNWMCAECGKAGTEAHKAPDADGKCICGFKIVAQVNSVYFDQFDKAVEAWCMRGPNRLTLLDDVGISQCASVTDKDLVLDLNGKTWTNSESCVLRVGAGSLTIIDYVGGGSIESTKEAETLIEVYGRLYINGNVQLRTAGGAALYIEDYVNLSEATNCSGWQVKAGRYGINVQGGHLRLPEKHYLKSTAGTEITNVAPGGIAYITRRHEHTWSYSLKADHILEASCTGEGECSVADKTVTIQLVAPESLTFDGQAKTATIQQTPADVFTDLPAVSYCCAGGCINAGEHTASLTYGGVTAEKTFTIAPIEITDETVTVGAFDQMIYDGQSQTPKAAVTLANGMTVTGTWSDVTNVSDKTTFTASGNFTGTLEAVHGMLPKTITITGATIEDVLYQEDGQYTLNVTGVSFGDEGFGSLEKQLILGTDYTATAVLNGENAVGEVPALVTVTLLNENYTLGTANKGNAPVNIIVHTHDWEYTAEGNTITATCANSDGHCPDTEQSLKLTAPEDSIYSGEVNGSAEVEGTIEDVVHTLTYHGASTGYSSSDTPVNADTYTVTLSVEGVSVSDTFTISPKDISVVQSIQFSLAQTSFVYSGEAPALNVTGVDSSVGNYTMQENTDYTVGTVQVNAGSHKLTVTGMGNYTGSVELDYSIAAKPITITDAVVENVTFDPAGYTLTVKEVVFDGVIEGETLVMGENGDYAAVAELTSENAASDAATANVTVSLMNANYSLSETTVEATFQITQSGTAMTATADKNSYTYGETITVTGTVKATGTAPATTLTLRSAPAAQQVALFAADGTQLTDPVNVVDGAYTLIYNTADKGILPAESITLTVKFVGDDNMADATANVSIALTEKQLTATEATATTRAYEPDNTTVSVTAVTISGVIGTDDVKVDATNLTGEISSSDAGTYTSVKLADLTLIGNDKEFYTISDATVTTSVEITPKEITNPTIVLDASSFVYDGTEKKPAVTAVKDGDDLIDAAEYTVSYTNNIEMGTATVTLTDVAGGNYTVSGSTTFHITQSGTEMTATADKNSYTYGETITVIGTVKATGTAPAATLTLRSAPAAQQVALFAADGTQLTAPVNVVDGAYTLTYNTADKGILPAEAITLTVKFVGDDNMADQSAAVTVALTAKSIEPVLSGSASKAYDGTTTVTDAGNLTINLTGIITGDSVSAAAAGYAYADEIVGQSKNVTAKGITLSGADSTFYTLAQTEASAQIGEIKKAMLIGLTEPADTTLDVYCADADAVIGKLPDTVVYHLADGKTVDLKVEWSYTAYDSTPGATNTFAWAVSDSEKLACYEIAQNVADDGTIIVTNSAFLPVTVTGTDTAITYNGTTYDVTQMFAIDSNAGAAVFEIIGGGTGEGTLNGSVLTITKAGTINIKVTTAPNAAYAAGEATAVLTISKGTPAVTVPTGLTAWYGQKLSDIALPTVDGGAWSWTDTNSTVGDAGVQTHQAIFTPANTNLWNITTHPVNITVVQAGTSFGEMKVYNGNAETTTFTYGETITVKAEATAVQPAVFSLRSLIAPAKHQMALFIRTADGSEVQISEAVNEQNGVYTMTYNTTGKALSIGDNALIAKFVGDENMADYQETVLVTLNPKELTIASLTAQDRVYEPGNQQVAITGTEVSGKADANDDVSVLIDGMTATISSENVGTYDTALIPQDVSLTGSHAGYYFAAGNVSVSIPQGVEITQATPYTTSGAPARPVFDPIYQDGQTLGDIPVSLPAGTFNVPGTIEWVAPGDTPVTEGTPFTWVFTPDDPNWKPVSGTVVIYPDGEPPVITAPAVDQEVTVYEGEQGTMFITAADASSYQWYINRYDGLGYVPISGETSASYTTSVVNLDNDGFTYYCVASNAYGDTESPVFLLQVLEKIEVPETGDESNIALWTALAILSFAGLTIITMNGRRSKTTR